MKKVFRRFLNLNSYAFHLIYVATLAASIVETFTYKGFIRKNLFIPFKVLFVVTVLSGTFTLLADKRLYQDKKNLFYKRQIAFIVFVFIVWIILLMVESLNYNNYVFSTYHITPNYLVTPLFLAIFYVITVIIQKLKTSEQLGWRSLIVYIFLFAFFYLNLQQTIPYTVNEFHWPIKYLSASTKEKLEFRWGKEFISYVEFIKKSTPENSTILIPPRLDPWGLEGNDHVMRAFLYPRRSIRHYEGLDLKKEKIEYVLISAGFSLTERKQFPQFEIPAKKIIIFDPLTKKTAIKDEIIFDFEDKSYTEAYGLIIL